MTTHTISRLLFALSTAGVLFSGYLSAVKLFSGVCAFNESCPYFLGYPACWYGFGMFSVLFLLSSLILSSRIRVMPALHSMILVSGIGILFAGHFVLDEIWPLSFDSVLGLPTCVYGLVFYAAVFVVSAFAVLKLRMHESTE